MNSKMTVDQENGKGRINNVIFYYTKLQDGSYKYQSKTEKEFTVDCVVDKATAKSFKKIFPKNGYREIETDEFQDKFKTAPPFPDEDEQYVVKLKTDAQMRRDVPKHNLVAGDLIPYEWNTRPKVFEPSDDGKGVVDITMLKLVGNGSKGDVAFTIMENSYGQFPKLSGILVKELVEYVGSNSTGDSDFGSVVGGLNPGDGNLQQKANDAGEDSTEDSTEENRQADDFNDDSIPF